MQQILKVKRELEWQEIEALVITYQKRFLCNTKQTIHASQLAAAELVVRFQPLFAKYLRVIQKGVIYFNDPETKAFVFQFIDKETRLKYPSTKKKIVYKFNFVVKHYGVLEEEEIMSDMQTIFMKLMRRYKQVGKSFCGYIYNVFAHEMSRHIKQFLANPIHIETYEINDIMTEGFMMLDDNISDVHNAKEILDFNWLKGEGCDALFRTLDYIDRKILMHYYLNGRSDKQISADLGMHINTINQRRHKALAKILESMPHHHTLKIKRCRHKNHQTI